MVTATIVVYIMLLKGIIMEDVRVTETPLEVRTLCESRNWFGGWDCGDSSDRDNHGD